MLPCLQVNCLWQEAENWYRDRKLMSLKSFERNLAKDHKDKVKNPAEDNGYLQKKTT